MNWEAIGAIDELIGAGAVLLTLIILVRQVSHSTNAMLESNRLERASAIDRHSDSIGRWRGRLIENADLAQIWATGLPRRTNQRYSNSNDKPGDPGMR